MSYPIGNDTPDGFRGIGNITKLQDVTPPGGGGSLRDAAELARLNFFTGILGGFSSLLQALGSFGNDILTALLGGAVGVGGFLEGIGNWSSALDRRVLENERIANDHSGQITEIRQAIDVQLLQGVSKKYTSNNTHFISPGVTAIEIVIVASGGSGGAGGGGSAIAGSYGAGGGGGGGGEVHFTIPRAAILDNKINIICGKSWNPDGSDPGHPAQGRAESGSGGGPSSISALTSNGVESVSAGGGVGGSGGSSGAQTRLVPAAGGSGMIIGGTGGVPLVAVYQDLPLPATPGGNSVSPYSLSGGGGGGGAGGTSRSSSAGPPTSGGQGGISPGGTVNGWPAQVSGLVATGAGGGVGARNKSVVGSPGAYPGGGGGGGWSEEGILVEWTRGGVGGGGCVWIIERTT